MQTGPEVVASAGAADTRAALLDAAEYEIGQSGAGVLSLRAVARRAGVSHQAPAHFFVNRRGLLTALAARSVEQFTQELLRAERVNRAEEPLVRLFLLGMAYVDFASAHPGLFTLTSSPDQIDVSDAELIAARDRAWSVLARAVHAAQETGWRADQRHEVVALWCWSIVHGAAALWREGWLTGQFADSEIRQAIADMVAKAL